MSITIMDVAMARGIKPNEHGGYTMGEFERLGLPLLGGCEVCEESLAAYNMRPSTSGYVRCAGCIGTDGFETVEQFEEFHDQAEEAEEAEEEAETKRRLCNRILRDLHELQGMAKRGLVVLPANFVEADFVANDDFDICHRGKNRANPVAIMHGDGSWDVGFESYVPAREREEPPDYDYEVKFGSVATHMTSMWIALMYVMESINQASECE